MIELDLPAEQRTTRYRCPGEQAPIEEAVHLGRLGRFYPPCRVCPHRDQTGTLSARRVKRLLETRPRGRRPERFGPEGAGGVYLNDLDPRTARRMAAALGTFLKRGQPYRSRPPEVVVAGDGRPIVPEMVAAVVEGLRWAGCDVVDLGPATAPCLAFALAKRQAAGGLLVGNPVGRAQTVGLKFWTEGPCSAASDGPLEAIRSLFETPATRPQRQGGRWGRMEAEAGYLAGMAGDYHALRPLRFIFDTTCPPAVDYLEKLLAGTACEVVARRTASDRLAQQMEGGRAHFAFRIDDDGERCRVTDEGGQAIAAQRLLLLLARQVLAGSPEGPIVLEEGIPGHTIDTLRGLGPHVLISDPRRAEMYRTMRRHRAIFGGGPSGRCWFRPTADHYAPDALRALSHLLKALSQSDRPLSALVDAPSQVR